MLHLDDFTAWISLNGVATEAYAIEHSAFNSVTCWIASEAGMKFSVNWRNSTRNFAVQGSVSIDGVECDNHIMLDAHNYPNRANAVGVFYARTSDYTCRDFMFSAIEVTDDDDYLHTLGRTYQFGTITLDLWRLQVVNVVTQSLEHEYGGPVLEGQIVHERSKKAGTHHVKYGEEYASPAPVVDMVTGYKLDQAPCASFTFKYRPIALLMANGIVPRPVVLFRNPITPRFVGNSRRDDWETEIQNPETKPSTLRSKAEYTETLRLPPLRRRTVKTEPKRILLQPREVIDLT